MIRTALALTVGVLWACTRSGEDRALRDEDIGQASAAGITVDVAGGLGHIRTIDPGDARTVTLWAQAPILDLTVDLAVSGIWTFTVDNALSDLALSGNGPNGPLIPDNLSGPRTTLRSWSVELPAGQSTLRIAPPDAGDPAPWRFAVMGDIQGAMPTVDEVFARISAEPGIRFVVSTGDITDRGREEEYEMFTDKLGALAVPFYSTIGNHELWGDIGRWYRRFGRTTFHFDFRGVAFSVVDSASAGLDPLVNDELDGWLTEHAAGIHLFFTHYPAIDPLGVRQGDFASRREAQALLARLAAGAIDITFYGHLHTYAAFSNAGIPAHVSGGGGADPMAFDGIDRHFLVVDVDPSTSSVTAVTVVRVD